MLKSQADGQKQQRGWYFAGIFEGRLTQNHKNIPPMELSLCWFDDGQKNPILAMLAQGWILSHRTAEFLVCVHLLVGQNWHFSLLDTDHKIRSSLSNLFSRSDLCIWLPKCNSWFSLAKWNLGKSWWHYCRPLQGQYY